MRHDKTKRLVLCAMFAAIIFMLAFTPVGFIQLGVIKATIIHVPVIIGSILLGPKIGAGLGFVFGCTSLISNTITPVLSSFAFSPFVPVPGRTTGSFWALAVCFLPRVLVGVVPWYLCSILKQPVKNEGIRFAVAGVAGSLTNTLLVMHLIYFLFKDAYASAQGISANAIYAFVCAIIFANGIPEALIAGIITTLVCKGLLKNPAIRKSAVF